MSKFKVGDVVVVICDKNTPSMRKVGQKFTVGSVLNYFRGQDDVIFPDNLEPDGHGFQESQVILEAIYESPLYKALR